MQQAASSRPLYIGSEIYRRSSYGPKHPLAIPRVCTCTDLARAMGWLDDSAYVDSPMADTDALTRFHDPAYIAALRRVADTQLATDDDRARYRLGAEGNPVYPQMFTRPATSVGGILRAAQLTVAGGRVHVPGGGTHHGRRDRASGFCYLNDPVLGILAWLDQGLSRIVYLDIDAHHGDGVQDAFHDDGRVLTLSIHEAGRWPFTGAAEDRAGGGARNFPVPPGFNDTEMRYLLHEAVLPLIETLQPQAIMLQAGADALEEDPLAKLALSNNAHAEVLAAVMPRTPRLIVTGGGGYNPYSVARCWARLWAALNGMDVPPRTTPAAETVLRSLVYTRAAGRNPPEHWFTTLRDTPREGPVRAEVKQVAAMALEAKVSA